MEKNEFEQLKEKIKINFLQIEKILANFDEKVDEIERNTIEIHNLEKRFVEIGNQINNLRKNIKESENVEELKETIKKISKDVDNLKNNLEGVSEIKEIKNQINNLKKEFENFKGARDTKEFEDMKDKVRANILKMEDLLTKYNARIEDVERSLMFVEKLDKKIDEVKVEMTNFKKIIGENINEFKKELGDIKGFKDFKNKFDKIESFVKDFNENLEAWIAFSKDFNKNKDMYLELREAVIASIEKLKQKEQIFDSNIEEFAIITKKLEENERLYDVLSTDIKSQIAYLKEEVNKSKNNIEDVSNNKIGDMVRKIESLEKEVIPNKIDNQINELIHIMNEKMSNFATIDKFDRLKADIESRIQLIREPRIKPLENRMIEIEKDMNEIKSFIKNVSQRLPVVVE
jgi:chromosome segregation ATPase